MRKAKSILRETYGLDQRGDPMSGLRRVAIHEGRAKTRRELEGLRGDTEVTTFVLQHTEVKARGRANQGYYEPFNVFDLHYPIVALPDPEAEDHWCDGLPADEWDVGRHEATPVVICNGFSGPGFVQICDEHVQAMADWGAQVWVPVRMTLDELDEALWWGLLN